MTPNYNAYIFDLDGTLLDTMDDFVAVTNVVLKKMGGRTYTRAEMEAFFDKGGIEGLLAETFGKNHLERNGEKMGALWNDVFLAQGLAHTTLYPQVKETLLTLKARGAKLAVLSNKADEHTHLTIDHFLPRIFDAVHGACEKYPRKPDTTGLIRTLEELQVLPEKTAYVGDSAGDVNVAKAVGAFAVAVDYGYGTNGNIREACADATISSFDQLLCL